MFLSCRATGRGRGPWPGQGRGSVGAASADRQTDTHRMQDRRFVSDKNQEAGQKQADQCGSRVGAGREQGRVTFVSSSTDSFHDTVSLSILNQCRN